MDGSREELRQLQSEYGEMLFDRYMKILTDDPDNYLLLRPCSACSTPKNKKDMGYEIPNSNFVLSL